MKSNRRRWTWDGLLIMSIVLVAGVCSQAQQSAQAEQQQLEGRIVRIAPDGDATGQAIDINDVDDVLLDELSGDQPEAEAAEKRPYWIGIQGGPVTSPVLRTHLQLADDLGVVIQQVVPGSPAEKAGLRKHDVLLRVNGESILGMQMLQDIVRKQQAKPLELQLIRVGKETTITVVPEESPQQIPSSPRRRQLPARPDIMQKFMERLAEGDGVGNMMGQLDLFAPGMFAQGRPGLDISSLPGGVAVTITRQNDGPTRITVKQGDKSWDIVSDDPKSLDQLPEELRPFVENMLSPPAAGGQHGGMQGLHFDFPAELDRLLPNRFGGEPARGRENDAVLQRMDELEQRLQQLQRQLHEEEK